MQERVTEAKPRGLRQGDEPIPGFRLVRRRGRGGFGEVWEAEASGGIHVALKFVHFSPQAQAAELRAFNCVREIHHPNLLVNFGSWEVGGTLVVGMELADRSLWDRYIEAANEGLGGIPRAELLGYMADVAGGVDYLNEPRHKVDGRVGVGVQHRDIKPPNILLYGVGAKLADLGMALAMEGEQADHTGIWTFPYAAPEFFRGLTASRSDQYSLAVTYCQLRCGCLPFEGSAAAVTAGHLYGQPDLEMLPEAERPILERALAKEPDDRWPDCRSLVEALKALEPSQTPELLYRPDEPVDDIPRRFRSSTGVSAPWPADADDFDDAPPPSWYPFDPSGSLDGLMETAETASASPTPSGPEAHSSDSGTELATSPPGRRRSGRIGRYAASTLVAGLVIAAAGVHPTTDQEPGPRTPPEVAATGAPEIPLEDGPTTPPTSSGVQDLAPVLEGGCKLPSPMESESTAISETLVDEPTTEERPPVTPEPPTPAPDLTEGQAGTDAASRPEPARDPAGPGSLDAPAAALAAVARGRAHLSRRAFEQAIADFDQAIRLLPGLASSYFHRGLARHQASHYPEALADYSEAIRLLPSDPFAFIARGQAHHDLGAYDRAIADYNEAIRLRPADSSAIFRRGLAHYRSDDYSRALADFDETIRLDPKNKRVREFRDDTLARLGGRTRANPDQPTVPLPPAPQANPPTPPAKVIVTPIPRPSGRPSPLIRVRRLLR